MSCYCHTCKKSFKSLGIARHRAMHRDRYEDCKITYSDGRSGYHEFSKWKPKAKCPECNGIGFIGVGNRGNLYECDICHGTGE